MAMILTEHPDLVLMDLTLPDLSGFDAARRIKANPTTARIPIVAYTAWDQQGMRAKARKAGISRYLVKPVPAEVLVEVIEDLTMRSEST